MEVKLLHLQTYMRAGEGGGMRRVRKRRRRRKQRRLHVNAGVDRCNQILSKEGRNKGQKM